MKKTILNLTLLGILMFTIWGCEKKEAFQFEEINQEITPVKDYSLDNIQLTENTQDLQILMHNSTDKDEVKLNKYLYEIGLAIRELIKDDNFNQTIIGMAKVSQIKTAYLIDLKDVAPNYFQKINANLAKRNLSLETIEADMTHAPVSPNFEHPETAEIEKYSIGIFIPNLKNVGINKQPLLSPNLETDCSNDPTIEDHIVTWYYTAEGELKEIILGEEEAIQTKNPLFLLDHAFVFDKDATVLSGDENRGNNFENQNERAPISRFDSRNIRIRSGYRQETGWGNNSEYAIVGYRIESNGTTHWVYSGSGWKKIAEVKVNQINTFLYKPTLHAYNWTPYSQNKFFWNTFERDWNRSLKSLGSASFGGSTIYLAGNMRYSGDWYAYIPSTLNVHATPFEWFGWEESVNFYSWKADYYVHRVN